jgi:hypothetical protein
MMRRRCGLGRALMSLVALQFVAAAPLAGQDSVIVTPGERYGAGWFHRVIYGTDYRELWATPITVPVLDLETYAGGLTPVRTGGFGQTTSLHFNGSDRRRYVFRSVDKDLSRRLAEELVGTFVDDVMQDQTSAFHPAAALVVAPLEEVAGVLTAKPEFYVMPDDPALGEFQATFAGMLGLMAENPDEGPDDTPGFAGSRLISGTERVFEDLEESSKNRVDAREYLKARLLDIYLGDRDRHKGQWRWARFEDGDGFVWRPVPEDRDQAFVKQDGFALWVTRTFFVRKFTVFSDHFHNVFGLTWNAWDLDRRILPALERPVWDSVTTDLQRRLTDAAIVEAVKQLPEPYYRINGERLTRSLLSRRDELPKATDAFYRLMIGWVDIHATDEDELAVIERGDRHVEVTVRRRADGDERQPEPHLRWRFDDGETEEIRLHLHGGDDQAVVRGDGGGIRIRVVGGGGEDELVDSSRAKAYFYDVGKATRFITGRGTRIDRRDYEPPPSPDVAHDNPVDWGQWLRGSPWFRVEPDIGLFFGGGVALYRYGFRKYPYSATVLFRGAYATGVNQPNGEVRAEWREVARGLHARLWARVSGLDVIRFHGFGNDTRILAGGRFHRVNQTQWVLTPSLTIEPTSRFRFSVGPVGKLTLNEVDSNRFIATQPDLYGVGTLGQLGVTGEVVVDGRDQPLGSSNGVLVTAAGSFYAEALDIREPFGEIHGSVATYLTPVTRGPTLALRVGGKKVWGDFPFYEAAFVGGSSTLRGFRGQRFAGDGSLYGNSELRIPLGGVRLILPMTVGVHGVFDAGRVFCTNTSVCPPDDSDTWHTAGGGGIWFSFLGRQNTVTLTVARSKELTGLYAGAGFMF